MDPEVKEIIDHIKKKENFLLSGGAGSGKTYSLVQVIREVLSLYPACNIACMTYTNAAVHEIERRVGHNRLNVSTIHDFLWDNIKNFQKEIKATLVQMLNDSTSGIKMPAGENVEDNFFVANRAKDFTIQYKEYVKIADGIISHNEVLKLSEKMFYKYPKLISFVKSRYPFIFIDEYQDTNPLIVKILLEYFPKNDKDCIIGFFGDSMQAIYNDGVGNLDKYIHHDKNTDGCVYEVQKLQNRRCPQAVIDLANKLRLDNLQQEPSEDINAPNMDKATGKVKLGKVQFFYSDEDKTELLKKYLEEKEHWDFADTKNTKELRLTHRLIASEAGFNTLFDIHDSDKIIKYAYGLNKLVKEKGISEEVDSLTLQETIQLVSSRFPNEEKVWAVESIKEQAYYKTALNMPFIGVARYVDKDQLLDDKSEEGDNSTGTKLSSLNQHLGKIEHCIQLYQNKEYNEFMRLTSIGYITLASQKTKLRLGIEQIADSADNMTISEVVDLADTLKICVKDDKFLSYIEQHPYVWKRVSEVLYQEARNVYNYRMGRNPFSTQHKTKGLEYDNVLVILKSAWNMYNYDSLFYDTKKPQKVVERTKKLFYVCCTRAREKLVVYYPGASQDVIEGAKTLFADVRKFPQQ